MEFPHGETGEIEKIDPNEDQEEEEEDGEWEMFERAPGDYDIPDDGFSEVVREATMSLNNLPEKGEIVVTRHDGLVEYLREEDIIDEEVEVIEHASPKDVRGKHVYGVPPLRLAAEAERITEIPLDYPEDYRGGELSEEQVREFAGEPQTYEVSKL